MRQEGSVSAEMCKVSCIMNPYETEELVCQISDAKRCLLISGNTESVRLAAYPVHSNCDEKEAEKTLQEFNPSETSRKVREAAQTNVYITLLNK